MKRMHRLLLLLVVALLSSCTDDVNDLGGDYYFVSNGGENSVITHLSDTEEVLVPCSVTGYDFDDNYIVAKSEEASGCAWDVEVEPGIYVIEKAGTVVHGPLSPPAYQRLRDSLSMPRRVDL